MPVFGMQGQADLREFRASLKNQKERKKLCNAQCLGQGKDSLSTLVIVEEPGLRVKSRTQSFSQESPPATQPWSRDLPYLGLSSLFYDRELSML